VDPDGQMVIVPPFILAPPCDECDPGTRTAKLGYLRSYDNATSTTQQFDYSEKQDVTVSLGIRGGGTISVTVTATDTAHVTVPPGKRAILYARIACVCRRSFWAGNYRWKCHFDGFRIEEQPLPSGDSPAESERT
jgi:hypothetical protein